MAESGRVPNSQITQTRGHTPIPWGTGSQTLLIQTCAVTPPRRAAHRRAVQNRQARASASAGDECANVPRLLWFLQRGSRWGSSTGGGGYVTWELASNAASQALPRPLNQPLSGWCLRGPPGDRRTATGCVREVSPPAPREGPADATPFASICDLFPRMRPSGAGGGVGGQAPRRRPRRSSRLSSSGVPALPPSASRRETPQARPTAWA